MKTKRRNLRLAADVDKSLLRIAEEWHVDANTAMELMIRRQAAMTPFTKEETEERQHSGVYSAHEMRRLVEERGGFVGTIEDDEVVGEPEADEPVLDNTPDPNGDDAMVGEMRDPLAPEAPNWARQTAFRVQDGDPIQPEMGALLKRWMTGDDTAAPTGIWQGRTHYFDPRAILPALVEITKAEAQAIAGPTKGVVVVDVEPETGTVTFDMKPAEPTPPPAPREVVREWNEEGAAPWAAAVGQAVYDGEDVPPEALAALKEYRYGVDVEPPAWWRERA